MFLDEKKNKFWRLFANTSNKLNNFLQEGKHDLFLGSWHYIEEDELIYMNMGMNLTKMERSKKWCILSSSSSQWLPRSIYALRQMLAATLCFPKL
jgi:hypothetical protein